MTIVDVINQAPMFREGDPQIKALVDRVAGGMMKSGERETLYNKWSWRPRPHPLAPERGNEARLREPLVQGHLNPTDPEPMARLALIHALSHSVAPINEAFARDWPEAVRMNLLDDSLSADLARSGAGLDEAMHQRFMALADYAVGTGADAILFTCSAFGSCIDAVARRHATLPVLKPNEAMVAEALGQGGRIGLIATFAQTLMSMPPEFGEGVDLATALADGALDALNAGDGARHDALIAAQAERLRDEGCHRIALAQFSMARARAACEAASGLPVLTTVDSAVQALRRRLG